MFRSMTSNVSTVSSFVAKGRQTMHHVSVSPPLIPDGRISRVRLAATAFPQRPFPHDPKLKYSNTYTPGLDGLISSSTFFYGNTVIRQKFDSGSSNARHLPRAPLPFGSVTSSREMSSTPSTGVTRSSSLIRTHAPDQNPPTDLGFPYTVDPCRLFRVPAGSWPFPTLSLWIFSWMLGSLLRLPPRCKFPLLPLELRPSPKCKRVGGFATIRQTNSRRKQYFEAAIIH